MPTPIYHITHIDNLPSILKSGGLIANSSLRQQQSNYLDIAHGNIQNRRAITPVYCGAGGRFTLIGTTKVTHKNSTIILLQEPVKGND